jgi:hypothetical protein
MITDAVFVGLINLFVLQYSTLVIGSLLLDRAIKLGVVLFLALGFRYTRPSRPVLLTLALMACLPLSTLPGAFRSGAGAAGMSQALKYLLAFSFLPFMVARAWRRPGLRNVLLWAPVVVGAVIGAQALILSAAVATNAVGVPTLVTIERYHGEEFQSYGLLGFANSITGAAVNEYAVRAQSWFPEASTLGAFLLLPTFLSLGYLRTRRARPLAWLLVLLNLTGLILTFSLAAAIGLCVGLIALLFFSPLARRSSWAFRLAIPVLCALLVYVVGQFLLSQMHLAYEGAREGAATRVMVLLGKDSQNPQSASLVRAAFNLDESLQLAETNPLGIGLGFTEDISDIASPNALLFWLVSGGLPALLIVFFLQARLFNRHALPLLASRDPYRRAVAGAYVALTVHGLSNGTWINPIYLLMVGTLILTAESERIGKLDRNWTAQMNTRNAEPPKPRARLAS